MLLYLYAEPSRRGAIKVPAEALTLHRREIEAFATAVSDAEVRFASCSYREWLAGWAGAARQHAEEVTALFNP